MLKCTTGNYSTLKHELMHAVTMLGWKLNNEDNSLMWLIEGIATLSDPAVDGCDGHSFEERYIFFLQNGKLLTPEMLIDFPKVFGGAEKIELKIAYNQSAYLVNFLLQKHGIEKIKKLWESGMDDFEKTYGVSFEQMNTDINVELNKKHPKPIDFNWTIFEKGCH